MDVLVKTQNDFVIELQFLVEHPKKSLKNSRRNINGASGLIREGTSEEILEVSHYCTVKFSLNSKRSIRMVQDNLEESHKELLGDTYK